MKGVVGEGREVRNRTSRDTQERQREGERQVGRARKLKRREPG